MKVKSDHHVSISAFAYLFSELVQYQSTLGLRFLERLIHRERQVKRELSCVAILQFLSSQCWQALFGKLAESLERSSDKEDEYMIQDARPLTNLYVSIPLNLGHLSCASYIAGVARGILHGANFPAEVSAHFIHAESQRTVYLIKFN